MHFRTFTIICVNNSKKHLTKRFMAGTQWGNKKYMNMKHLEAALDDASIAG